MKAGNAMLEKHGSVFSGRRAVVRSAARSVLAPWLFGAAIGWAFLPGVQASNPIWINPLTCGTPIASYDLGDSLASPWYVNFEIGQTTWNYAQVGYGTDANGTGYNWGVANWYENGEGSNKRVRRDIGGLQFTATGSWYLICQANESGPDTYTSGSACGWLNSVAYPPASMAYFTVNALNDPYDQSATPDQSSQINLFWSKDAQNHNVMIVRKLASDSWTEPTQGTAYSVSDPIGSGTVVYNGDSTVFYDTGLDAATAYDYKFYSENYSYYSAGVTASATTLKADQTIDFPAIGGQFTTNQVGLAATASSGLSVSFAVESGPGTIDGTGTNLTFSGAGTVSIVASQAGDGTWNPAPSVTNTFDVIPPSANLVAWYPLDGNGNDSAGTNHGTVTGATPTTNRLGQANSAYYFDGSSDYVTMTGASTEIQNSPISVSLWFQSTQATEVLLEVGEHNRNETRAQTGYGLMLDNGYPRFSVNRNPTGPYDPALWDSRQTDTPCNDGNWHHLVAVFPADGTTRVYMYVDGALASMVDVAGQAQSAIANEYTVHMTRLGELTSVASVPMTGRLDDVRIFNKVLSPAEVSALYQNDGPTLAVELSQANVNVREAGEGRFFVRLNQDPGTNVAVNVAWSAGDAGITVQDGAVRDFNSGNWNAWQTVTLAAAADGNTNGETATIQVSLAGASDQFLTAAALDDDISENLALATGGSEITSTYAFSRPEQMIDGVHTVNTNYGYTICTSVPPGTITLDMKTTATVSRIRLLTWDWSRLDHRYQIESSADGSSWDVLIDASGADHHGWDDWPVADEACRYLRFTGVSTTQSRDALSVAELEVYGARDLSSLPKAELFATNVNVREAGEGRFFVRLDKEPEGIVIVNVAWASGDPNITLTSGATRSFKASNWSAWQAVSLAASADANTNGETATFRVSIPGRADQFVTATALDDDIGSNLALASAGSTVASLKASRAAQLIDGVHVVSTNYGYTIWTNATRGTITLDMKQTMILNRVRLLNWDWVFRVQRYQIEASTNGTSWSTVADASAADRIGWDDWNLAGQEARYLRFTGISNSANQCVVVSELEVYGAPGPLPPVVISQGAVNVREAGEGTFFVRLAAAPTGNVVVAVSRISGSTDLTIQSGATRSFTALNWNSWQEVTLAAAADENSDGETATFQVSAAGYEDATVTATALDDDIAENVALASGGATITGWKASRMAQVIDGIYAAGANYGYTIWTNSPKGIMTLDMGAQMTVSRVRLLNWNWVYRVHRYTIEASTDGASWSTLIDATGADHAGWDDWAIADQTIRYLRFTGTSNSANAYVCISELEVYGTRPPVRRALSVSADSEPVSVVTSDDVAPTYESGWAAVDGDPETAWIGQKTGGGNIVVEYGPTLELSALEVDLAEGSLTNVQYLYSLDAQNWQPLPEDLEANPVSLNFLWLLFPGDGTEGVPQVFEIRPNP